MFFIVKYKHWTKYTHNGHVVKDYTLHHCIINSKWYTSVPDDIGKYYTTGWIELISVEEFNLKDGEKFEYSMGGPYA